MPEDNPIRLAHAASKDEHLWIHSMSKKFRVRHVSTSDEDSNRFMANHPDTALIACFGPFNFVANVYEGVREGE